MKNYIVEGTVKVLTPLFHGGDEKTGSTPVLRTIMIYSEKYGEIPIPFYSGNALRGKARRLLMKDFLNLVDYEITNSKLYHVLFAGGLLETRSDNVGVIDLALRRQIREMIPPISLLGTSIGNQIIPGILIVEHMFPICEEYLDFLPEKFRDFPQANLSVRVFTDQSFITRRDDIREEREAHEQAIQMKVDYECFVPGTRFYHRFVLQIPNELQISCFGRLIELLYANPYLGGKSAGGDGKVDFNYSNVPDSQIYLKFINEHKKDIHEFLKLLEGVV